MKKSHDRLKGLSLMATHFINELKAVLKDPGAMLILVGAVLVYSVIYSYVYSHETLRNLEIGIVDMDHTETSRKYAAMIDATPDLNVTYNPLSLAEAEELFMANKIKGVLLIPEGFQKEIMSGQQANAAVYSDASNFLKYRNEYMAVSYVNGYFNAGIAVKRYMFEGQSFTQAKASSDPLTAELHVLYNPASGYGNFVMPGIILVIIQQTLLIGIGLMGGSFSESKASPFLLPAKKRWHEVLPFLFGKAGAYLAVTLFNMIFGVIMVHHWFNYPDKAAIIDVLMLVFPYSLAVIFLGIGLSTLFRHRESAIVFMVFLSPIALFLSGLSWPASAMPAWLVTISKVLPSTQLIPAYMRLRTMGVGISGVRHDLLMMYLQAFVYIGLTLIYFYARVYREKRKRYKTVD